MSFKNNIFFILKIIRKLLLGIFLFFVVIVIMAFLYDRYYPKKKTFHEQPTVKAAMIKNKDGTESPGNVAEYHGTKLYYPGRNVSVNMSLWEVNVRMVHCWPSMTPWCVNTPNESRVETRIKLNPSQKILNSEVVAFKQWKMKPILVKEQPYPHLKKYSRRGLPEDSGWNYVFEDEHLKTPQNHPIVISCIKDFARHSLTNIKNGCWIKIQFNPDLTAEIHFDEDLLVHFPAFYSDIINYIKSTTEY